MTEITPAPHTGAPRVTANRSGQVTKLNETITRLSVLTPEPRIVSRTTATAPGSPDEGDAYIMPSGTLTGWPAGTAEHDICYYSNGWHRIVPEMGYTARMLAPELGVRIYFVPNTGWLEDYEWGPADVGLTASATQTQGQMPLTKLVNHFSTVATANDACTLPTPRASMVVVVANTGSNTLQVFPNTDNGIDANGDNNSVTVAAGKSRIFIGISATNWVSVAGA